MTQHTFALITPTDTHYIDVTRSDGDDRAWRDIVLEHALAADLISEDETKKSSVLSAVRPAPPHAVWR